MGYILGIQQPQPKFEDIISNSFVIEKFKSKKNNVSLLEFCSSSYHLKFISKEYSNQDALLRELTVLYTLMREGVNVPSIYGYKDYFLYMEYIEGHTLMYLLEKNMWSDNVTDALVKWFCGFYNIKRLQSDKLLIKGDCNLKNFIYDGSKIYGIDFEESQYGNAEQDIGELCSHILLSYPEYTDCKKLLVDKVVQKFLVQNKYICRDNIESQINRYVDIIAIRRKR